MLVCLLSSIKVAFDFEVDRFLNIKPILFDLIHSVLQYSKRFLKIHKITFTMKSTFQTGLAILAAVGGAVAVPAVTEAPKHALAARAVATHAPHTANHAPVIQPSNIGDSESNVTEDVSQFCIDFTSDNPNWGYVNSNPWSGSGTFGSSKRICVPTSNSAGGAMYIGPGTNPGPGSTKFECYFPTSGTANCDMSLVDGYSLSVTCKASGQTIGGAIDLWTGSNACPDTSNETNGICKNDHSYDAAQSDVAAFFQPAITGGNQYCIWVNCSQDYYFPVTSSMSCHVSGTTKT